MATEVVGREAETAQIVDFLDAAAAAPTSLVIEGDAGIGKTTLWLFAIERARQSGCRVLGTRTAHAESVLAYASLTDLLSGVEPAVLADLPAPQRLALDRVTLLGGPEDSPTDPRAVAAAFLSVVKRLTGSSRVLIAIDDLQWLDPSSAAVIAFAARRLSGPVGVLATLRSDAADAADVSWLRMPWPDAASRLAVGPLSLGALHAVIVRRLGRSLPRPLMVHINEISGGNPLYALELARAATDEGLHMPRSLAELVRRRLAGVNADARDALLAAACAGAPTVDIVARATDSTATGVVDRLADAEAMGIVCYEGRRLRFGHPVLAAGVYADAAPAQRRAMHRSLAAIVEEPELRARHLALATTTGDRDTLHALDAAAESAGKRGAPVAAAELLDFALELGGDTPERRIRLAGFLFDSGNSARARRLLEEVVARDPGRGVCAEAFGLLAVISQLEGSLLTAADELSRALELAEDDLALRARILVSLAWVQIHIGDLAASVRNISDAAADARAVDDPHILSQALGMKIVVGLLSGSGCDDEILWRATELESHESPAPVMFRPSLHAALAHAWTGRLDAAQDALLTVRQRSIERGEESALVFIAYHEGLTAIWRAAFGDAALIAENAVQLASQLDGPLPMSAALTIRALTAAYAGHEDGARRDLQRAIEPTRDCGSELLAGWSMAALGFLEVSLGRHHAALTALEPLVDRLSAHPEAAEIFAAWFVPDAVESFVAVGRAADAEALVDMLERNGRRLDRPWMLASAGRGRAMLLAAGGELDAAADAADRALIEHRRLPMPFERARTQLLAGQLERRRRRNHTAATGLRQALQAFEDFGTPLWAHRARTELGRANVGHHSAGTLTPSEQRVAELAASGMTNREVAAALFISPKTVEANLARVYRKLGIRSRAELGRHMGGNTVNPRSQGRDSW
ncbi:transcriptional regulator, luxR family [Mycolicibacterium chubuense NBB4]|uniref:Transcriptional regulator, luxR family n=1 Tax=Mycolicibacterium chubuense (strain NBB4) TaxID=710421 RepID=I4BDA1_MYCCN|nr:AAA family ATPase [Mycolicibacterium chubuense]AFM15258.1 transcriptional regulator, luxR family [Mycolicibacterium chubuense NBB4]